MVAAWDIYAQQLMHLGHGHALWGPEPSPNFGEVHIGDVGYLRDGCFNLLFNAMLLADDPVNSKRGVPEDFEVFSPPPTAIVPHPNWITQTHLHSRSLQSVSISMSASAGTNETSATTTAGLRYECNQESGALLMLKRPAHKHSLDCRVHIQRYIRKHITSWCNFANDRHGIGLEDKDIIFVFGTTKTSVWAEAAFHNSSARGELVVAGGCFVPSVSGEFRVLMSRSTDASVFSRAGPYDRISKWQEGGIQEADDQCMFLNYYKMKSRGMMRGPKIMRGAGGYHQLPDPGTDDDSSSDSSIPASVPDSDWDYKGVHESLYDPVDCLLNYILEHSETQVAFASDDDLIAIAIFGSNGFPQDLEATLQSLGPQILTHGDGSGTIVRTDTTLGDEPLMQGYDPPSVAEECLPNVHINDPHDQPDESSMPPFIGQGENYWFDFNIRGNDLPFDSMHRGSPTDFYHDPKFVESARSLSSQIVDSVPTSYSDDTDFVLCMLPPPLCSVGSMLSISSDDSAPSMSSIFSNDSVPWCSADVRSELYAEHTEDTVQTSPTQSGYIFSRIFIATVPQSKRKVLEIAAAMGHPLGGRFVPQRIWRPHTISDRRRYEAQLDEPIMFFVHAPTGCGIRLQDAIASNFSALVDRDDPIFASSLRGPTSTATIRLNWPGYPHWSRQISVRESRSSPRPITRAKLAQKLAKTIDRFIKAMVGKARTSGSESANRWRVGTGGIRLEDLMLVGLENVSMGSWQAHVRLIRRAGGS